MLGISRATLFRKLAALNGDRHALTLESQI
jgi:hypothetical protein